jgi:hypothetical protein
MFAVGSLAANTTANIREQFFATCFVHHPDRISVGGLATRPTNYAEKPNQRKVRNVFNKSGDNQTITLKPG